MEEKHHTPSVMARLMGLDEQTIPQRRHRRQKLLSEEYLRRVSSIGVLGKRSNYVDRLKRSSAKKQEKQFNYNAAPSNDAGSLWPICNEEANRKVARTNLGFFRTGSMPAKSGYHWNLVNPEKRILKVKETEITMNELPDRAGKEDIGGFRGLSKSKTTIGQSSMNFSMHISSHRGTKRLHISHNLPSCSILGIEAKTEVFEQQKMKNLRNGKLSDQRCRLLDKYESCDARARTKKLYPRLEKYSLNRPYHANSKLRCPLDSGKKDGVKNKYLGNSAGQNLLLIPIGSSNLKIESYECNSLSLEQAETETPKDSQIAVSLIEDHLERGSPLTSFEKNLDRSACLQCDGNSGRIEHSSTISNVLIRNVASINGVAQENVAAPYEDESSEITPGTFTENDGSPDVGRDLAMKISSHDSIKGEWHSRCQYDPDLEVNLGDANQPTPDSVLEPPFSEGDSPVSDLRGLAMKLQLLDSRSERTNSECSAMAVSTDEDAQMDSYDLPQSSGIWEMIRPEESRDFSYLVDVLDEAGISCENWDEWHPRWHAKELPMDLSVFEALEKKYGKQTSWHKSERRLLFDLINSGLTEILPSVLYVNTPEKKPLRRFSVGLRRAEIEDELWKSLLPGKEVSKDMGEKALSKDIKCLELEEDVIFICTEIEQCLFDELVAELGSA